MAHLDKSLSMITSSSLSTCCAQHIKLEVPVSSNICSKMAITGLQLHSCQNCSPYVVVSMCVVNHDWFCTKHDGVLSSHTRVALAINPMDS